MSPNCKGNIWYVLGEVKYLFYNLKIRQIFDNLYHIQFFSYLGFLVTFEIWKSSFRLGSQIFFWKKLASLTYTYMLKKYFHIWYVDPKLPKWLHFQRIYQRFYLLFQVINILFTIMWRGRAKAEAPGKDKGISCLFTISNFTWNQTHQFF